MRVAAIAVAVLALPSTAAASPTVDSADGAVYRGGLTGRYFHPLGSFARLNRVVSGGHRRRARRMADSLIARGHRQGRFALVWYYNVPGGRSGWTSGMAQAVAAEALARAGRKEAARRAFLAIPNGLLTRLPQGPWIKLYGYSDVVVLNAQLQAALSIGRYARLVGDPRGKRLARELRRTARALLPRFDSGSWSFYSLGGEGSTLAYHRYVTKLLWQLADRQAGGPWRVYANRFAKYHRLPPVLRRGDRAPEVFPEPADGFRDFAPITFWLSKPATVTFRIAGTRTSGWFRRGWQTFHWWPFEPRARPLPGLGDRRRLRGQHEHARAPLGAGRARHRGAGGEGRAERVAARVARLRRRLAVVRGPARATFRGTSRDRRARPLRPHRRHPPR